ncbi:DUF2268 domain-containing putative Zn-dependent protease [Lentibacillus sp. Marseille-P4043]|uniref:DUF2268 domain-containing putative Zn-dependent protease n=1 Tax=Lentibacillus sp. Marseille-P4043 TaxID=2040293 RepID=UPI00131A5D71|nr:DUF2268 domain-containing putative Zn-dependent protease [Lentibacillus sp. Marseille-P4043]
MKKSIIFFLVATLVLAGCQNLSGTQQTNNYNDTNSKKYEATTKNKKGQVFRVISAYKWANHYVQKAKDTNSESDRSELWQKLVKDHIQDQCLNGEYSHLVKEYVSTPPESLENLKVDIEMLDSSNLEEAIIEALKASAKKFPGPETTVCILPQGNGTNSSGVTLGSGKITIFYSPSQSKSILERTIAHEYHHSTWTAEYSDDYRWDLLGSIIFEGKAEYFASLVFGQRVGDNYVSAEQEKKLWGKVKESIHSTNLDKINTILYGGENGLPYNYGYFLGYQIVRRYVENHPGTTVEEWSKLSPKELYEKSGYEDSL